MTVDVWEEWPDQSRPCAICDGALPVERLGANHVGVRFGHHGFWRIRLDGMDVTTECREALAGDDGWVALYARGPEGRHVLCSDDHARLFLVHGAVRVFRQRRLVRT